VNSRIIATATLALAAATVAYIRWLRPRQMYWGATPSEVERVLPGDELVPRPTWNATRAVTVEATPGQIWPWLVQIGWGRAGWYGYDWADNGFRPSSREILPAYQEMFVGKEFPMSPVTAERCYAFEPERWMLWRASDTGGTWLWYLDPVDEHSTRLITRMRDGYRWANPLALLPQLAVDLFDFPFMRKCMLGVKERAEQLARDEAATVRTQESAAPPL
jgi:hypothetical protein